VKTVSIIGGGESGVGAALLAQQNDYRVFVSDFGIIPDKYKSELIKYNIPFEEEGHDFERIEASDVIIKSPGISDTVPLVKYLISKNHKCISEIEFASWFYTGKIIGVTGSNGKSTTVSLIYHLLKEADINVGLGGNIGYAFSRLLIELKNYECLVLELSSFQLDDVYRFRSDTSVILNVTADHLDRYNFDINSYARAKWRLVECVSEEGMVILNSDDVLTQALSSETLIENEVILISGENPEDSLLKDNGDLFEVNLIGKHNLFNTAVGVAIARDYGISDNVIQSGLLSFEALEHRLEKVATVNDVIYINDSKATNIDAVKYALSAVKSNLIWIAGGTDKGNDYSELIDIVEGKVKMLICLAVDCEKLKSSFGEVVPHIMETQSMEEAVRLAYENATENEVVLLSPACASFDLFDNYMHRGDEFKKEVFKIK